MRTVRSACALAIVVAIVPSIAIGAEAPIEVADLLVWASASPPDWFKAGLFAIGGLIGALVTCFGLIGGAVPGTNGFDAIDASMRRLEAREEMLDKLLKSPNGAVARAEVVARATNELRDDIRAERWKQYGFAAFLYVTLGAFFAVLMAHDVLQSILIGAGWTSFVGALRLKGDLSKAQQHQGRGYVQT